MTGPQSATELSGWALLATNRYQDNVMVLGHGWRWKFGYTGWDTHLFLMSVYCVKFDQKTEEVPHSKRSAGPGLTVPGLRPGSLSGGK